MARTVVVGLDGASWRLLDPWIEEGALPNVAALRERGAWAETRSCLPPVTFPNWKCYSSGKNPGGFGVFWFERVDLGRGRIEVADGSDFHTAELWDYLNAAGQSTGVVNMPTTYPPRPVDGVVVCGGPDAVDGEYRSIESGYTYPEELAADLVERFEYRVHPEPLLSASDERGVEVEAILDLLDTRFEVALSLLEERDLAFVHVTLFYLNVLQHFFWNDPPTRRAWELVDEWLGRLADLEDTNLVVMSDHGSAPTETEFYVNEWLASTGYQARERTVEDVLQRLGVDRETVLRIAKRAGVVDLLAGTVPERIQQLVPQRGGVKRARKLDAVDLDRTLALASGQGPIYLHPDRIHDHGDGSERSDLVSNLVSDLRSLEDGRGPLFEEVHRGEDLYSGPFVDEAPAVVLDQRPGVHVNDGIGGGEILTTPDRWAAENTPHGIFLATGPDFRGRGELSDVSILDIAPTLLVAHDCAVPTDMDGEVLPLFDPDRSWDERDPIRVDRTAAASGNYGVAHGEEDGVTQEGEVEADQRGGEAVTERLRDLGYME